MYNSKTVKNIFIMMCCFFIFFSFALPYMIRCLLPIAILTGAGQLFSIFAIKFIAANSAVDAFSDFVQADAFYQLLLSIIAFGLQSMAMRELVLSAGWKSLLKQYQLCAHVYGNTFTSNMPGCVLEAFVYYFLNSAVAGR